MKKDKNFEKEKIGKFKHKTFRTISVIVIAILVVGSGSTLYHYISNSSLDEVGEYRGVTILEIPSFITIASASESLSRSSFLDDEAGISAYTNVGEQIDLDLAKNAFRTIEYETDEYIIGSVPLPDYPETEDVHCYVHVDGWILSYYLNEEPASKIVDWEDYTTAQEITGTKLEDGIYEVCSAAYVVAGDIGYYDFRYPNAEKMMIVADALWDNNAIDTFNITLPSDFIFYERSFSHCANDISYGMYNGDTYMYINQDEISHIRGGDDTYTNYGLLLPSQLPPSVTHIIKITNDDYAYETFDAIVLIYRES